MTFLKLLPLSDEGAITDPETAAFIQKRRTKQSAGLDFSGITDISNDALTSILDGIPLAEIPASVTGLSPDLAACLQRWLSARSRVAPPPALPSSPGGAERYTPTRLVRRLRDQLTRYLLSAYPLSDTILIDTRKRLIEEADAGHLICQEPFVETNARYRSRDGGFASLGLEPPLQALYARLAAAPMDDPQRTVLFPSLYEHQAQAIQGYLRDGRDLVVATGTGSGKTECFLLPMIGHLYREAHRPSAPRRSVRSLILYPMNALVNDQLSRLRLLFGSAAFRQAFCDAGARPPLFGMYTGRTPYPGPRDNRRDGERVAPILDYYLNLPPALRDQFKRMGRYPAKDLDAFYARHHAQQAVYRSGEKEGKPYTQHRWERRLLTGPDDAELLTRQEMVRDERGVGGSPDILITNYSMLEFMLMRPFERPIFQETADWLAEDGNQLLLVLDEAHMYRGSRGAEIAFLIRRLCARLGIQGRPDKLRVIATSASLGEGDAAARVLRFVADLTGKPPSSFQLIQGQRDLPAHHAPGDDALAGQLAGVDLSAVHEATDADSLQQALSPALTAFNIKPSSSLGEDALFALLYSAMRQHEVVNHLLTVTAGRAVALSAVAREVFPVAAQPVALAAVECLMTLGVLARPARDEPGLLPARLHLMLRGLNGIYACANGRCPGRQSHPHAHAPLGRMFTEYRDSCDACGSRVFEMASCRECGTSYLLASAPKRMFEPPAPPPHPRDLRFLWGENTGSVRQIQILTAPPRTPELAQEARLHLPTGFLHHDLDAPPRPDSRPIWLARERTDGHLLPAFPHCPICLPPGARRNAKISDFRSRGEQPFTAIIEAQFSEQPPQKHDPSLPNRGRKILVFSDGRQKAARLAPALETSHARDAFRQILMLAADQLERWNGGPARLSDLYPAVVWLCASKGINVFPLNGPDEHLFHAHLRSARNLTLQAALQAGRRAQLQPAACFAQAIFSELTDRFYSLQALGLGTVQEDPDLFYSAPFTSIPPLGLSRDDFMIVFRQWLRTQFELNRFLPGGARRSLRDGWTRPEGIDLRKSSDLLPLRVRTYVQRLLTPPGSAPQRRKVEDGLAALEKWLADYLRSGVAIQEEDRYYFECNGLVLRLRLQGPWFACTGCGRVLAEHVQGICPECLGNIVLADNNYLDDRTGYYRDQVHRAFDGRSHEPFGLLTAEHSAQLTGIEEEEAFIKTERYEMQFQDVPTRDGDPPIDVLSCTTTMEVGVDIGALSGVALRNVPPHVANYQQRAGRAGRRGRSVASVITYAHGSSHDAWYYADPARMISGAVLPPVVYIQNQQILERHINAWIIQRFFHDVLAANPGVHRLLESLGTVEEFLSAGSLWSLYRLRDWALTEQPRLIKEMQEWIPAYSWDQDAGIDVSTTVHRSIPRLIERLEQDLPLRDLEQRGDLNEIERELLALQLSENLLKTLIDRAIVPRYAFPTDVVSFWVAKRGHIGSNSGQHDFEYQPQRELSLALSEYAPGRSLTIDKYRYTSAAIYSPHPPVLAEVLRRRRTYASCAACGFVSLQDLPLTRCPVCRSEQILQQPFIVPNGFAPDINEYPEIDRGGAVAYAGQTGRAELEVQEPVLQDGTPLLDGRLMLRCRPDYLVSVNKGIEDRGFLICPACGRAEPTTGPQFREAHLSGKAAGKPHTHPLTGAACPGRPERPFYLGYQFPTDVLLIRALLQPPMCCPSGSYVGRVAASTAIEALILAASRLLQIDEGELGGNWIPVADATGQAVDLFLYDTLPGGAGYARLVRHHIVPVLHEALRLLETCEGECSSGCYRCVLHYGNRFVHPHMNRHMGAALLRYVIHGQFPALSAGDLEVARHKLTHALRLQQIPTEMADLPADVHLSVHLPDQTRWVLLHHPLSTAQPVPATVLLAKQRGVSIKVLDTFSISTDLPSSAEYVLGNTASDARPPFTAPAPG